MIGTALKHYKTTLYGAAAAFFGYLAHAQGVPYGQAWGLVSQGFVLLMGAAAADGSNSGK